MRDSFRLNVNQSVCSISNTWYRNLQVLGAGGNAVTFLVLATSGPHHGVPFALKVFRKLSKPERRERFLQEIAFLQACEHPSILRVFDRGIVHMAQAEYPFVVAEYLPQTLDMVIRTERTSVVVKRSFALQLLSALAYLADLDPPEVHRDIKPQNVFVKGG
jgi:eukaryotic-like serine/threonine-protein kinase